jgi:hypothetical protein
MGLWRIVPVFALGFLVLSSAIRILRIESVSDTAAAPAADTGSMPRLIVPGHHNESFEWLDQTRQMLVRGEWRVRRVDYENAPYGRGVDAASPYRWWLGLLAWCHHEVSGRPLARSVEWAALVADPLLLILAGTGAVVFVFRKFGALAAALLSAGLVTLFPFASEFLPGIPDDRGLALACAVWSVLPIFAGADPREGERRSRRLFVSAGLAGGIGLWINVSGEALILLGIAVGALFAAWAARASAGRYPAARLSLPLRDWALAGAAASFAGYLVEYFPNHLGSWELRVIHPAYSLAWLGAGELLARLAEWIAGRRPRRSAGTFLVTVAAAAAVASVPAILWASHGTGFLAVDLTSMTLSKLPGGVSARNFWALLLQNGIAGTVWATVLPALLVLAAAVPLALRSCTTERRTLLALSLGPALVSLAFACWQVSFWNVADVAIVGLLVAAAATVAREPGARAAPWVLCFLAAIVVTPGAVQLWPSSELGANSGFTETEVVGLVERDLAYWLARHVGSEDAVILAPPDATTSLYYYGGLRGIGTFAWENRDGISGAVRIMSASTPEEAQELIVQRGVTHIVIPSWDPYMEAYARMGEGELEGTFLERLRKWVLPPWLLPVAYLMPSIAGFEGRSVTVLEVVEPQNDAVAASRLAEYFVDTGQGDLAADAGVKLRRYLGDAGALVARAEIAISNGHSDEFARIVEVLLRRISGGADHSLAWDQRVRLAIVLTRAEHTDLARAQLRRCIDEIDERKLRSLSTKALFRFQILRRAFGFEIADPGLRNASIELLPSDLRNRLK